MDPSEAEELLARQAERAAQGLEVLVDEIGGEAIVAGVDGGVGGEDGGLRHLLGRGDGTFAPPVQFPVGSVGSYEYFLRAGDLNGDGRPDLVAGNANESDP